MEEEEAANEGPKEERDGKRTPEEPSAKESKGRKDYQEWSSRIKCYWYQTLWTWTNCIGYMVLLHPK